jgi:hypothetical protein
VKIDYLTEKELFYIESLLTSRENIVRYKVFTKFMCSDSNHSYYVNELAEIKEILKKIKK